MLRVVHHERSSALRRRLVLRHLLDISEAARRVGHHSIAQVIGQDTCLPESPRALLGVFSLLHY